MSGHIIIVKYKTEFHKKGSIVKPVLGIGWGAVYTKEGEGGGSDNCKFDGFKCGMEKGERIRE